MARHRHQEFIRFLNRIEAAVPAGKLIHAILDNYAVHKHPKVRAWLARHPRWTFHFTPTSCSWANAVESFFATLTRRRLKRGVFRSLVDLQAAIKPLSWRTQPQTKAVRLDRRSGSHHRKGQSWVSSVGVTPLEGTLCLEIHVSDFRGRTATWARPIAVMSVAIADVNTMVIDWHPEVYRQEGKLEKLVLK
jgi:transposase